MALLEKQPKKTPAKKTQVAAVAMSKDTNKHRVKLKKNLTLPKVPTFGNSLIKNPLNFNSVGDIGDELDKYSLIYFDIPDTTTIDFPKTSSEFFGLFWELNKNYVSKDLNGHQVSHQNAYRSLAEIYLTFKFYYSKMSFNSFLKTFFNNIDSEIKEILLSEDDEKIDEIETVNVNSNCLSSLVCGTIDRRVYTVKSIAKRHLSHIEEALIQDEFGFTLVDYIKFLN